MCNENGKLLKELEEKDLCCMKSANSQFFFGGMKKRILMLSKAQDTVEIDWLDIPSIYLFIKILFSYSDYE